MNINEINEIYYFTVTADEQVYKNQNKRFTDRSGLVCLGQHIATIVHHHTFGKNDSMNTH